MAVASVITRSRRVIDHLKTRTTATRCALHCYRAIMETRNTDKVLHENVDCRIIMTEQHALGIDVGGSVIVRDPLDWHRMAKRIEELETVICGGVCNFQGQPCGECEQCQKIREVLASR